TGRTGRRSTALWSGIRGAGAGLFLNAEDGVLGLLGDAKFEGFLCRDLDGFTRLRVTAGAGFALYNDEFSKAGEGEAVIFFCFPVRDCVDLVDDFGDLLFRQLRRIGEMRNELGLCERFA